MRVTQTMLALNTLRHIGQGYERLGTLQDQLATGKRITRASQDPMVAMKGIRYRTQVAEVEQFKRNLREVYNWMDTADSTLNEATQSLQRIRELATQASNDTYEKTQRANIAKEIKQLREHLQSMANTKNSTKYIFNGTDTTNAPITDASRMDKGIEEITTNTGDIPKLESLDVVYDGKIFRYVGEDAAGTLIFQDIRQNGTPAFPADPTVAADMDAYNAAAIQLKVDSSGAVEFSEPNREGDTPPFLTKNVRTGDAVVSDRNAVSVNTQSVEIELLKGVTLPVNVNPSKVFNNALFGDIIRLEKALEDPSVTGVELTSYIDNIFAHIDNFVAERAELGSRVNRVEMIESRIMEQEVIANRIMSENEDADLEKVIIDLTIQESVHRAALASGARIVQPTLMDFLR
ncbi:flagellar hook-associated protein FlgL [Halalkalibacterium ligniniphilum]|uniref:flagellar hook-associated protein FlgL n=1 Tax=Halalkalibacterium ligniniphilum TaxID=1134413 RepID=UPI00034B782E|nr:flagellar hook-associated protein FlgL [Halalkalibacterium ligniniphilum]